MFFRDSLYLVQEVQLVLATYLVKGLRFGTCSAEGDFARGTVVVVEIPQNFSAT